MNSSHATSRAVSLWNRCASAYLARRVMTQRLAADYQPIFMLTCRIWRLSSARILLARTLLLVLHQPVMKCRWICQTVLRMERHTKIVFFGLVARRGRL